MITRTVSRVEAACLVLAIASLLGSFVLSAITSRAAYFLIGYPLAIPFALVGERARKRSAKAALAEAEKMRGPFTVEVRLVYPNGELSTHHRLDRDTRPYFSERDRFQNTADWIVMALVGLYSDPDAITQPVPQLAFVNPMDGLLTIVGDTTKGGPYVFLPACAICHGSGQGPGDLVPYGGGDTLMPSGACDACEGTGINLKHGHSVGVAQALRDAWIEKQWNQLEVTNETLVREAAERYPNEALED